MGFEKLVFFSFTANNPRCISYLFFQNTRRDDQLLWDHEVKGIDAPRSPSSQSYRAHSRWKGYLDTSNGLVVTKKEETENIDELLGLNDGIKRLEDEKERETAFL